MTQIEETELPGVGVRYGFMTRNGRQLGVIVHRTGERDLIVYCSDDPDRCALTVRLDLEEAAALGELLVRSEFRERSGGRHQNLAGLAMDWLVVDPAAEWAGRTLGEAAIQAATGATVVAIIRGSQTFAASELDTVLQPGDTVVAVGTAASLADLARRLRGE